MEACELASRVGEVDALVNQICDLVDRSFKCIAAMDLFKRVLEDRAKFELSDENVEILQQTVAARRQEFISLQEEMKEKAERLQQLQVELETMKKSLSGGVND